MQDRPTSPFHQELFSYLLNDVEKKAMEGGLSQEAEVLSYKSMLEKAKKSSGHSFVEILDGYHKLVLKKKTLPIEQKLLTHFPAKEFPLKMLRGLPRLYKKDNPSINHIKYPFNNLLALKKLGLEKFLLPFYEKMSLPKRTKLCLFTYVLPDGWGDLSAHQGVLNILKKNFPEIQIQSVVCLPKLFSEKKISLGSDAILIPYKGKSTISKKMIKEMLGFDLILSLPTHHPQIDELKNLPLPKKGKNPRVVCIGQYGFIESGMFHPKSGHTSMGLHFLEKGVLTREEKKKADFRCLKNETLKFTLFGTLTPQSIDIETYLAFHKLHLAYLVSPIGGATYLHALLGAARRDDRTIDICTPDLGWLIEYMKKQGREKKPFLNQDFGICEIEIHFAGKIHRKKIQDQGKKVRILCPGSLDPEDFSQLMHLSQEFVAVRGDQSFSEAVSANRLFFYDGAPHACYFVKDLIALAENRLRNNPSALAFFRSMNRTFLHNLSSVNTTWVEETFFQEIEPWEDIAANLSRALLKRETLVGCKQLNQIIQSEYSFNKTLCQMVAREISHHLSPEKESREYQEIDAFVRGSQDLRQTLKAIRGR